MPLFKCLSEFGSRSTKLEVRGVQSAAQTAQVGRETEFVAKKRPTVGSDSPLASLHFRRYMSAQLFHLSGK